MKRFQWIILIIFINVALLFGQEPLAEQFKKYVKRDVINLSAMFQYEFDWQQQRIVSLEF